MCSEQACRCPQRRLSLLIHSGFPNTPGSVPQRYNEEGEFPHPLPDPWHPWKHSLTSSWALCVDTDILGSMCVLNSHLSMCTHINPHHPMESPGTTEVRLCQLSLTLAGLPYLVSLLLRSQTDLD